jgi:hypothetical protein
MQIKTHQQSADQPQNAQDERDAFRGLVLGTVSGVLDIVPEENAEQSATVVAVLVNPLVEKSEGSEPSKGHEKVEWVMQEAPGEWYQPDKTDDCR